MLTELTVENLGVIDRAEVEFDGGSIALTGETGAGKTLLVLALGLLLGARSDRDTVRSGAGEARVEGRYSVPSDHPVVALLRAHGVLDADPASDDPGTDDVELVVVRTVPASGRGGKARINGRLVTAGLLADLGGLLTEVAGQHEHQRIGDRAWQRAHLDEWAGPEAAALSARVREAVRAAATAAGELAELRGSEGERERTLDVLRYEIAEIEAAAPAPGESEWLAAEARRLDHAESIAAGLDRAAAALTEEGAAVDLLAEAARALRALAADDPALGPLAGRLEEASLETADVASELARGAIAPDPAALEATQERISVLSRLRRKYGPDEDDVIRYLEDARRRAAELDGLEEGIAAAQERAEKARAHALELAAALSNARRDAADRLGPEIERRLATLALEGATLEVRLEPADLHEGGLETVEYLVSFNPGEEPRPLRKVASGGELSRLRLALALAGSHGNASTMVFDEVDAGVGGAAARAVGAALAELAEDGERQVMVVTHLPQVAAFAGAQYRVVKSTSGGRTAASIERVEGRERVAELSRMLAGLPGSESARGHAEELLEHAARTRPRAPAEPAGRP